MKLVVGLGNPGECYKLTRHNIGFLVAERTGERNNISLSQLKHHSVFGHGSIADQRVIIAKPLTYMNLCGKAVKELLACLEATAEELIVVHDDLDMEFGKIKIKEKGGYGGHNGVRSIIRVLGMKNFVRLKIGIGRPVNKQRVKDYVLSPFDSEEMDFLPDVIQLAEEAVTSIVTQGVQRAMNTFNGKDVAPEVLTKIQKEDGKE